MPDKAWKARERRIARFTGGERVPINGRGDRADVEHPWMAIEAKQWASLPIRVVRALEQAEKAARVAKREQLPVAILARKGQHTANALVVMRLDDFKEWFGDV